MPHATFIPYQKDQLRLLPLDLDEMVDKDHLVRVVDHVIDSIDTSELFSLYPGGGRSSYHPCMILKVLTYAYASGIYSSRKIEQACKENIHFLWISGQTTLDHTTIARFRSGRLKEIFEVLFASVVELVSEMGYITLDTYFLDGTKIEANANKYTFTWQKNTERYQDSLRQKVHDHLEEIDRINEAEDELFADREPGRIDSDKIRDTADKINELLKKRNKDKDLKRAKKAFENDYLPRMEKYEEQQKVYEGRKSFSKTDTDATFMRMKEDHMRNGQLKAGYNVQTATEEQFVVDYTLHRRPGDTACMIENLEHFKEKHERLPETVVADAGYGSEENYEYLEGSGVRAFVKYNSFHREQKKSYMNNPFNIARWPYDEESDTYTCPEDNALSYKYTRHPKTELGYESTIRVYECDNCCGCPSRSKCIKSENPLYNRRIQINERQLALREQAKERLLSEEGIELRRRRATDVETVFGDIKQNWSFTRFMMRGIEKVSTEWGLICLGHNMRKLAKVRG